MVLSLPREPPQRGLALPLTLPLPSLEGRRGGAGFAWTLRL